MTRPRQSLDDTSVRVSAGNDTFSITFCEVPRAQDNAVRSYQHVYDPVGGDKKGSLQPAFPFKIYNSPALNDSRALAIKDDKAFAIRLSSDSSTSAFKVQVKVGGVNIIQHHQHANKGGKKTQPQDYFVVYEQEWIWGTQVGNDTARQFRVFGRKRERLSLRHQLHKNNHVKEVEIQITSRRRSTTPPHDGDTTSETSTLAGSSHDHEPLDPSDQQQSVPFSSTSSSNRHPQPPHAGKESPHEMVIGTGGLIRQLIIPDKNPEDYWGEDPNETITLKFKIFNPTKPNHFRKVTGLPLGNPGGNWNDKQNPAKKFFRRQRPVAENPREIREDIRSPQEIESDEDVNSDVDEDADDDLYSDLDSAVAMGRTDEAGAEEDEQVSQEERDRFAALQSEAQNQRRERPMKEKRKKKGKTNERRPSGLYLMVVDQAVPVTAHDPGRRSRWRKILEAMRRVLSPGLSVVQSW